MYLNDISESERLISLPLVKTINFDLIFIDISLAKIPLDPPPKAITYAIVLFLNFLVSSFSLA